jgi:hypothetical protein
MQRAHGGFFAAAFLLKVAAGRTEIPDKPFAVIVRMDLHDNRISVGRANNEFLWTPHIPTAAIQQMTTNWQGRHSITIIANAQCIGKYAANHQI